MNSSNSSLDFNFINGNGYVNNNSFQYPNNKIKVGLRDRTDQSSGLVQTPINDVQFTTVEYTVIADTRDCIGTQSLLDAQSVARLNGVRDAAAGTITHTTGAGVSPIVVTFNSVAELKNGDTILIRGVQGNTNANGKVSISNINITTNTAEIPGIGNGAYLGGGEWLRTADAGYPILTDNVSFIEGNRMIVNLNRPLKNLRTLSLYHIVIPRDIIPLQVYMSDFIPVSTTYVDKIYVGNTETNYTTFIKEEVDYTTERLLGFFSSPLDLFRAYRSGSMSMPDQVTPPPLTLWNPPIGNWPGGQPISYPYQTVPTYKSGEFSVVGQVGTFYVILSGYGVYDLLDWSVFGSGNPTTDALITSIMRKLLLILIAPKQSYRNVDYVTLIINSNTISNNVYPYGFGSFQRFICGGNCAGNYQPGTNLTFPGNPSVASTDSPIPFPNFRGNVLGPYSAPGDHFQKIGIRTLVQDLFLNGDLNNLFGDPIINPSVPTENIPDDKSYGLNFLSLVEVNLGNITTTTNLNILNAGRINPNGFGAVTVRANGNGNYYTNVYNSTAGGQGPSALGTPSAWTNNGIYSTQGSFTDPIAQGPAGPNLVPSTASALNTGTSESDIFYRTAYDDLGPGNGIFVPNILKYINYVVNDVPDTDLIIKIEEVNNLRFQSTNSFNNDAIIDTPIRLNIGSTNGTEQYIESIQSLVAGASSYWEQRYMNPKARLEKLHMSLYSYNGFPIPLERMLQERRSLELSRLINTIVDELEIANPFDITYLFDPANPQLIGRMKRYMQIIFKINCYEGTSAGIEEDSVQGLAPYYNLNDTANYGS
jgi:hypothetical protein